ncbi:MAG TPA: TAT-variant-translocated molybdopterin oxidoreductase [Fimbriimonadaceae bacterium]|nr:TAT-variant-translocated molybdopterin oxidoreductase [Fimbriimonadaceae bacterium]HRJ33550.1 TAT-variant-translocated molybdopterin oxidoreductase [Fimbriimonadaceae bacterium]
MAENQNKRVDIAAAQAKLASGSSREYWKGLEELAETPEFTKYIEDEFPERQSIVTMDRRNLLKFMGASLLLGGLGGCRNIFMPQEKIVPYVKSPEDQVLGRPLYYASTFTHQGYGYGVVVQQNEGRPTKIEGNTLHSASLGRSDSYMQASLLSLYDPDRLQIVQDASEPASWDDFFGILRDKISSRKEAGGQGLAMLFEPTSSPTTQRMIAQVQAKFPNLRVFFYDPVPRDAAYEGTARAFGEPMELLYDFTLADVVVSFDHDFLHEGPGHVRYTHDFAKRRDPAQGNLNRLYAMECTPTLLGAMADHRAVCRSGDMLSLVADVARKLGVAVDPSIPAQKAVPEKLLNAMISDLMSARGRSIVTVSDYHSADVHVLVHAINAALDNFGATIRAIPAVLPSQRTSEAQIVDLIGQMNSGLIDTLLIFGGNPSYTVPKNYGFNEALSKVNLKVHHTLYFDETSERCDWSLPASHYLEAWGDARSFDGQISVVQPLIAPLYNSESVLEILSVFLGAFKKSYEAVRETWKPQMAADFEKSWREVLHNGVVPNSNPTPITPAFRSSELMAIRPTRSVAGIEVNLRPDPTIWDGQYSNNGWLQELPKPLTTLTWDNAAILSPRTAERLGLDREDIVEISSAQGVIQAPVLILPGQMDEAITVHLGYGRTRAGRVGSGANLPTTDRVGFDASPIKPREGKWSFSGAGVKKVPGRWTLATCQEHHYMEGRDIIRAGTPEELAKNPNLQPEQKNPEKLEKSLYPDNIFDPTGYNQWAMTVDLSLCTGCNACVTACQAENNISVVGKDEVRRGREMHWMRIDRYYRVRHQGQDLEAERIMGPMGNSIFEPNSVETYFMPLMCQHCEKAPCEPVCPVAATVHSHEGLNQMVYNRCVGTRYCSNNCPYKVRRFNYYNYSDNQDQFQRSTVNGVRNTTEDARQLLRMVNNPNVTVRGRGVMEKCTYCVQRINLKRIEAKREGRDLGPDEVVTACQQACPAGAIVFGDMSNPNSQVSQSRRDPRTYKLLQETGTRPRTTYKVRVLNPNPEAGQA